MKPLRWGLIREQILVQLRTRTLNYFTLAIYVAQPATFAIVGFLLSRAAGNTTPDLVYTVIGGGIMGMWSGVVFTSTYDITSDRRNGMLEIIVGSSTSLAKIEALRTLTNVLSGLVSLLLAFLAAFVIFRLLTGRRQPSGGILIATIASFWHVERGHLPGEFPGLVASFRHIRRFCGNAHCFSVRIHVPHSCFTRLGAGHLGPGADPLGARGYE